MNAMKTTMLLGTMTVLFVYIGSVLGGQQGMVIALLIACGMNFYSYYYSDKMVLKMYKAQPVTEAEAPWLYDTVQTLASRAGLPMPKVYVVPGDQPNAFATGRNPENAAVAVTQGITRILSKEELAGVLAHELAHVNNRDILIGTIAATFAGAISMLGNMAFFMGGRDGDRNPIVMIAMMIIAPMAAMMVQMTISRTREYMADRKGAELVGSPVPLANALRKLHNASQTVPMQNASQSTAHMFIVNPLFGVKGLSSLFSTHPPMEKRIAALMAMESGSTRSFGP